MFNFNDVKLEMLVPGCGKITAERDGLVYRKTTPHIIFAQAEVGHYELDAAGQHLQLAPGEALFTPPNLPLTITHRVDPESGEMRMRRLHFNVMLWGGIPIDTMFEFPLRVNRDIGEQLAAPIEELLRLQNQHTLTAAIRKNLVGYTCLQILMPLLTPKSNLAGFSLYSSRLIPIVEYIRKHLDWKLTVSELAAHSKMSRAGLYQLFAATLNVAPHQYLNRLRLELVAEKLRGTDQTIGEIAEEMDFPNQFLLSRQFKAQYGLSPSEYRQSKAWQYDGL